MSTEPAKTYTKVCPKHGIRYDPTLTSGCVRCRREMETRRESSGAGVRALVAIAAVVILVGGYFLLRGGGSEEATGEAEATAEAASGSADSRQARAGTGGLSHPEGLLRRIRQLIRDGRSELGGIGEIGTDVVEGSPEAEEIKTQWDQWGADWEARLDELGNEINQRPQNLTQPQAILAYEEFTAALEELGRIPEIDGPGGVAPASEREYWFRNADQTLTRAQQYLDDLSAE